MTHLVLAMVCAALIWVLLQTMKGGSRCQYCGEHWGKHESGCPYQI